MNELWIETPRGHVYGQSAGNPGDPLVLGIHGWSQRNGWHTWQPLLPPLAAAGFYAVSVDMPGWGQSPPWKNQPLQPPAEMVPVVLALLDGLGAARASLMGKSWGGGIALETALAYPDRVDRLILTAPAFRSPGRLAGLAQPVLMAWARDDPVIPVGQAEAYMRAIPQAQLEVYEAGGHSAAQKNVPAFAPKAIAFLRAAGAP